MAQATVPQPVNFTRDDLNAAASAAQRKVGNDKAWQGAIARALVNLASGQFAYDGHQVLLHSGSRETVYRISTTEPMTCTCKGRAKGYRCWHIVAARLIVRAAERHARVSPVASVRSDWSNTLPRMSFAELTATANAELF